MDTSDNKKDNLISLIMKLHPEIIDVKTHISEYEICYFIGKTSTDFVIFHSDGTYITTENSWDEVRKSCKFFSGILYDNWLTENSDPTSRRTHEDDYWEITHQEESEGRNAVEKYMLPIAKQKWDSLPLKAVDFD